MGKATTLLIFAAALLLSIAVPAVGKEGFSLGAIVLFNDISGDINSPEWVDSGNGFGLHGGFGLNGYLAIEAGIWKTKHDQKYGGSSADLKARTLDLKINIPASGGHIEPYLLIGAGSYTLEQNGYSHDGKGSRIGIGMDIYLFPDISFNVGFTRNNVTFTYAGQNTEGKITTMDFGIAYHFM